MSRLSVVLLVYNQIDLTARCMYLNMQHCIESHDIIFIDNNSDDATKVGLEKLREQGVLMGHNVKIIYEPTNTGIARAWNKGIFLSEQKYICILNNDCVLMPGWDTIALKLLDDNNGTICTPLIIEPEMLKSNYNLDTFLTGNKSWRYYLYKNKDRIRYGVFGGVVYLGATSEFKINGYFDENFWLSLDDMDFILRYIKNGKRPFTTGNILGFHCVKVSRSNVNIDESKNLEYFKSKWGWDFFQKKNTFQNKLIRKWNKLQFRIKGKMGLSNYKFPI